MDLHHYRAWITSYGSSAYPDSERPFTLDHGTGLSRQADALGSVQAPRMAWKLHSEVVLLAGWGRAILLELAHPLVARAVADHSAFVTERWGRIRRLQRTLSAMLALTFGTAEEARRVAEAINAIHDRVHGRLGEGQGIYPAETSYSAHDPALLRWVHVTLVDSFLLAYELFVGPLTPWERDRYCAEASAVESQLGVPAGYLPRNLDELRHVMDAALRDGTIAVTPTARALAREIVAPPAPLIARPLVALARLSTVGLLPPTIREAYGFCWDARRERGLRLLAAVSRRTLPALPSLIRHWPAARAAFARERRGGA